MLFVIYAAGRAQRNARSLRNDCICLAACTSQRNPDEFRRLQQNPRLIKIAAEEIVRWTSPVIQFARTATQDTLELEVSFRNLAKLLDHAELAGPVQLQRLRSSFVGGIKHMPIRYKLLSDRN